MFSDFDAAFCDPDDTGGLAVRLRAQVWCVPLVLLGLCSLAARVCVQGSAEFERVVIKPKKIKVLWLFQVCVAALRSLSMCVLGDTAGAVRRRGGRLHADGGDSF